MKIRALVQSEQWLNRAGVRIRYRRIAPHLERLGVSLTVDVIDNLDLRGQVEDDVVILSKCTDARALLAADYLRERGVIVGVDMFDDYFSPKISPCHVHREFLHEMAARVDFFLCSTDRMRDVARMFASDLPAHVLNDPFDVLDKTRLTRRLREKAEQVLATKRLDIVWFGNGENPLFPVGLTDLTAYAPALQPLLDGRFEVHLKVLTNARALHTDNLARLRTLPLQVSVEEWSEEGERKAMDASMISFLPVNHQNFSIAKSLNRGISSLTGGTQILSAGSNLYGAVGDFVYRDAAKLLRDLRKGKMLLRPETVLDLEQCMDGLADPANEAARLLAFVRGVHPAYGPGARVFRTSTKAPSAVLHGRRSPSSVQSYARHQEVLSIGSPFCPAGRRFDMSFEFPQDGDVIQIFLAAPAAATLTAEMQAQVRRLPGSASLYPYVMELPDGPHARFLRSIRPSMIASRAGQMVHYVCVMAAVEGVCTQFWPDRKIVRSELESPLMGMSRFAQPTGQGSYVPV